MELRQEIINILNEKGLKDLSEEYELRMSKSEMISELTLKGYSKEAIDEEIEKLCTDGGVAMDEINIYVYDEPL